MANKLAKLVYRLTVYSKDYFDAGAQRYKQKFRLQFIWSTPVMFGMCRDARLMVGLLNASFRPQDIICRLRSLIGIGIMWSVQAPRRSNTCRKRSSR